MGFLKSVCSRGLSAKDAFFPCSRSVSFITQSTPSLLQALECDSFCSSRNSPSASATDARSVSIGMQLSNDSRNICKPFLPINCSYHSGLFRLDFCRSIHSIGKIEFSIQPVDDKDSSAMELSRDAERICKILAKEPKSSINHALDCAGVKPSPDFVTEVLKKLSNAGVLALAFFQWAERRNGFRHTSECYHLLIEAMGKIKQFRLIWNLVDAMKNKELLTKETFTLISRRYARAKMVKEAIGAFEKMGMYDFTPDLSDFNRLIDTLSKAKKVKIAQDYVYLMRRRKMFLPDLKTYTILMEGWGQILDLSMLTRVYQEMTSDGFKPDLVTYGILTNAFCKCRKLEEALKIFHEMETREIKPSPHIYCNLINGLGSDRRLNDALRYFEKFKASGFAPELPTYNAVVGAYCWARRFENAYAMLDEMKRNGICPNSRTYDVILHHLISAKRTEEAYRLFQRMGGDGCKPEINIYIQVVRMFCADRKVDMALQVWNEMTENGILPCLHMFLVVIESLCCENRLEEAQKLLEEMLDRGIRPPGQLYSSFIQALRDGGKKEWATSLGEKLDKLRNTPLAN